MSDHQPYFILFDFQIDKFSNEKSEYRKQTEECFYNFRNDFDNSDFSEILKSAPDCDPNITYNLLHQIITSKYNRHFPIFSTKFKKYKVKRNPWITNGLLKSIRIRDKFSKD